MSVEESLYILNMEPLYVPVQDSERKQTSINNAIRDHNVQRDWEERVAITCHGTTTRPNSLF